MISYIVPIYHKLRVASIDDRWTPVKNPIICCEAFDHTTINTFTLKNDRLIQPIHYYSSIYLVYKSILTRLYY